MYFGVFPQRMDEKGRISIPAIFRAVGEKFFLVHGPDNYLCVYDNSGYQKKISELETLDEFDENARAIRRVYFSCTVQECDSHGRIKIPIAYITHANLNKEIVINGMGSYFEIRDKTNWEKMFKNNLTDLSFNMNKFSKTNSK